MSYNFVENRESIDYKLPEEVFNIQGPIEFGYKRSIVKIIPAQERPMFNNIHYFFEQERIAKANKDFDRVGDLSEMIGKILLATPKEELRELAEQYGTKALGGFAQDL